MTNEEYFEVINQQLNSMAKPPVRPTGTQALPAPAGRTKTAVNIPAQVGAWYNNAKRRVNNRSMTQPLQYVDANGPHALGRYGSVTLPQRQQPSPVMQALGNINSAFKEHASAFNADFDPNNGVAVHTPMSTMKDFVTDAGSFVDDLKKITGYNALKNLSSNMTDEANAVRIANGETLDGQTHALPSVPDNNASHALSRPPVSTPDKEYHTETDAKKLSTDGTHGIPANSPYAALTDEDEITNVNEKGVAYKPKKKKDNRRIYNLKDAEGNLTGTGSMIFHGKGNVGGISNQDVLESLINRRNAAVDREIMLDLADKEIAKKKQAALPHMMSYAEALGKTTSGRPRSLEEAMVSMRLAKNVLSQNNRNVKMSTKAAQKERELNQKDLDLATTAKYRDALTKQAIAMAKSYPTASQKERIEMRKQQLGMINALNELRAAATTDEERIEIDKMREAIASGNLAILKKAGEEGDKGHFWGGKKPAIPPVIKQVKLF